jgi:3,4-dihydroxy 2-butanone 4-phosphate synthase/GTP cyclohydrolase II
MTQHNSSRFGTAFTETIEAREGVTTGISAADRAHTIRTAIAPGRLIAIWPGRAYLSAAGAQGRGAGARRADRGVGGPGANGGAESFRRDLRDHARRREMARIPDLIPFCKEHGLQILTVAELIRYRLRTSAILCAGREPHPDALRRVPHDRLRERSKRAARATLRWCAAIFARTAPHFRTVGPAGLAGEEWRTRACLRSCRAGAGAYALHGGRCVCSADCHCREILDQSMRMIAEEGCGACSTCTIRRGDLRLTTGSRFGRSL